MYSAMEQMSSLFFSVGVMIFHRIGGFAVAGNGGAEGCNVTQTTTPAPHLVWGCVVMTPRRASVG